ncbi:hypothetical protein B9T25_09380 [Acinetobacter sp. ANC 4470]|uniref:hypothetical protein n=1 Tax=Acinetobacter sp. ANC 4470 TaxID=1977881 RepID=UPI000A352251|nr:hypothetical protein [Acinetobacter sp. ANC 4470]OTG66965.1 hypothetical protein B9T25_09380 [Acinetobacter sp. ANC 4470]
MNSMTKLALVSASVLSIGALTACQSNNTIKDNDHARMMKDHHPQHERKMTAEQREQFQQARHERKQVVEQIKNACDSKAAGTAVQIKAGEKTLDGTCTMTFKPDRKAMKQMHDRQHQQGTREHRPMRGEMRNTMHMQRNEPLTDARRAELTKQFNQRLAERQATQQAIAKACQGQTHGKVIQLKVAAQTIDGQCKVRFQPKASIASSPAPVKSAT